jgi:uncharacterized protein YaeQ
MIGFMGRHSIRPLLLFGVVICVLPQGEWNARAQAPGSPPNPPVSTPPRPAMTAPGIDFFRQLLAANAGEREKLLAGKTPSQRRVLEKYASQYESLPAEVRDLRLRTMELRYQITSLLRVAPSNRADRLKLVPEADRAMLEERLKIWDGLSPEAQREILEKEQNTRILTSVDLGTPQRETPLSGQASNQLRQIEVQLVRWQSLPVPRREQAQHNFTNLVELTDIEKARERLKPLPLSDEERAQMQATLDRFQKLSPTQRALCIRNFEKFAELSPAERRQFLASAQEWQKMKPEDREAWRSLVGKIRPLPPLPSHYRQPPVPPRVRPQRNVSTAQNTN